ncbi:hypothetical protein MO973_44275 [Paenibacillus sp. TRM 82003]|nr:hypothetical protein [Paenibacillus sp. TRM 82003]
MNESNSYDPRAVIARIGSNMTNHLDLKNPYAIAWWSAAFPGFGHLILGQFLFGLLLVAHEAFINTVSGLNAAIYYSMIGDVEAATKALDTRWILAYLGPYIFSIWDSYQRTIQLNEDYRIAKQRGFYIAGAGSSAWGWNRLDPKKPLVAIVWSVLAPGTGHLYINRLPILLLMPWFVACVYYSQLLPAVHAVFVLDFETGRRVLDPQWLLFLPSIYGFFVYDAYLNTLEYNKLYKMHQSKFLERAYQSAGFPTGKP